MPIIGILASAISGNLGLSVEYLVIAGGGGGASGRDLSDYRSSGAGGAGGYRCSVTGESSGGGSSAESELTLDRNTSYTVTVGAGGVGAPSGGESQLMVVTQYFRTITFYWWW
jgi:hypothetical protein